MSFRNHQRSKKKSEHHLPNVKFEITKKEEDSPPHSTSLCPPVSSLPDTTSTPPPKTPPVSQTSYRNLSTRTTSQAASKTTSVRRTAADAHRTTPPPPPSTTSSTGSEDPVILTTNVPILPKARPGHPPLNTTWVGPPQSHIRHPTTPTSSHSHSTTPPRGPLRVTVPRPHHNGHLLPFNFSSDIKHYLNPTAHRTRQPLLSPTPSPPCPAPPAIFRQTNKLPLSTTLSYALPDKLRPLLLPK